MTATKGLKKSSDFLPWFLLLLITLGVNLVVVAQELADGSHDGPDSPVKSGYAIVTPKLVGDAPTSTDRYLVVFETFGQQRGQDVVQAGVLPASLSTDFLLFASTSGRLSRDLGVAMVNPGTVTAHVGMTLLDEKGKSPTPPATATVVLESGRQSSRFLTELFELHVLPKDFTGTLRISSDTPIAVVGLRFRGINFSTLPATPVGPISKVPKMKAASDGKEIGGDFAAMLPQFATGGGWASEIILINNLGTNDLLVRIDLFDKDGKALTADLNGTTASTFDNIPVPKRGVVVLSPRDKNGDSGF